MSGRGRKAARAMAAHIRTAEIHPDLILCSPAVRAHATLELVQPSLGGAEIAIDDDLYTFEATVVLERLRRLPGDVASVMVVGHNPAIADLAVALAQDGDRVEDLASTYPTGALAELELDVDRWSALRPRCGRLVSFVTPKDLR